MGSMTKLLEAIARLNAAKSVNATMGEIKDLEYAVEWHAKCVRHHVLNVAFSLL